MASPQLIAKVAILHARTTRETANLVCPASTDEELSLIDEANKQADLID